jgi:hypothetical protein
MDVCANCKTGLEEDGFCDRCPYCGSCGTVILDEFGYCQTCSDATAGDDV